MYKKVVNMLFIIIFMLICTVPLLFSNLVQGTASMAENRMLHGIAKVFKFDGSFNNKVLDEFSGWINDNIGFRSEVVALNAKIQFYIFDRFTHNSNLCLGPNGEVNSIPDNDILEYQHLNLKSEEELDEIAEGFQSISDYLERKGIQYYYMQCYQKYSIYPEHMPEHINQYGTISKVDQIMEYLKENTDINLVSIKDELVAAKETHQTYSRFGDAAHWTQRGSYIGYRELMKCINANNSNKYVIFEESDYNISLTDQGSDLFGGIHLVDYLENFELKERNAHEVKENLGIYADRYNCTYYQNNDVNNRTKALVIADSYINHYLLDELSETFNELVCIHGNMHISDFANYIDYFSPDIVIHESAECNNPYPNVVNLGKQLWGK